MRSPEYFDPIKVGRFNVIRVYYQFPGESGSEKLFVVLRHAKESSGADACWCIKTTSKTAWYEARPELMPGVITYDANELTFFPSRTIIDPFNFLAILHRHLATQSGKDKYKIEGMMPDDFHGKLTTAINQNIRLEPKNAKHLLWCIKRE